MALMKLKVDFWVNGEKHCKGEVADMSPAICQLLLSRNEGEYVNAESAEEKPQRKKRVPKSETLGAESVTVRTVGKQRTVTEP